MVNIRKKILPYLLAGIVGMTNYFGCAYKIPRQITTEQNNNISKEYYFSKRQKANENKSLENKLTEEGTLIKRTDSYGKDLYEYIIPIGKGYYISGFGENANFAIVDAAGIVLILDLELEKNNKIKWKDFDANGDKKITMDEILLKYYVSGKTDYVKAYKLKEDYYFLVNGINRKETNEKINFLKEILDSKNSKEKEMIDIDDNNIINLEECRKYFKFLFDEVDKEIDKNMKDLEKELKKNFNSKSIKI